MSIGEQIERCCDSGTLVEFTPIAPISTRRPVYLAPTLIGRIAGPWSSTEEQDVMPQVQAELENFVEGEWITATFKKYPNTFCKRLQDHAKSVWELRITDPYPGARLFGMFAAQDVFIGTGILLRSELDDEAFAREIRNAKAEWRNLFHNYNTVISDAINDYITENVVELPQS